jgi:acyl-CoA reductase-like NAD-dependent aldehyde dehydrogenase
MSAIPVKDTMGPFIGGRSVEASGPTLQLVSPNDLSEHGSLRETPEALIDEAVGDAHRAYVAHRRTPAAERAQWLNDMADAI